MITKHLAICLIGLMPMGHRPKLDKFQYTDHTKVKGVTFVVTNDRKLIPMLPTALPFEQLEGKLLDPRDHLICDAVERVHQVPDGPSVSEVVLKCKGGAVLAVTGVDFSGGER